MKFSNELQKEIVEYILSDKRFFYQGYTGTHFFASYPSGDESYSEWIDLKKPHSDKSIAKCKVLVFTDRFDSKEVELKIELYLNSYCEWDTMFDGWVENLDELKLALKMVGL